MDYYSPDLILANEETLNVEFEVRIRNNDLNTCLRRGGNRVEMPFFAIEFLLANEHCKIADRPLLRIQNELDAEAPLVNLNSRHFYAINRHFEDKEYLSSIFFQRIGVFHRLVIKDDFSEDDACVLSYEERCLILNARRCHREFVEYGRGSRDYLS